MMLAKTRCIGCPSDPGGLVYKLRPATDGDYAFLKHLHHTAMRDVVERTA